MTASATGRKWPAIEEYFPYPHRTDTKPTLFISNISIGDRREVLQGNGHRNQLVAICITPEMAETVVRAVNAHDSVARSLQIAIEYIEHMAAFITKQNAGYSFESLGEDMPGIRATLSRIKTEG